MKSLNLGDAQTHIVGSKNRSKNIFLISTSTSSVIWTLTIKIMNSVLLLCTNITKILD
jgi:hypothetical protein